MELPRGTAAWTRIKARVTIRVVRWLSASFVLLLGFSAFGQKAPDRPNIVLISIDTLRYDRLGCTGYTKASTPNLDRLAREGVLFEHVYTPVPLTLPAHTSMLTSTYPATNGVRDNGEALAASIPTLAEQFHRRGYQTAAFVSAFVLDRRFGLARGFDSYWGDFDLHRYEGSDPGDVQIRGDRVEAAAEQWLQAHGQQPFLLFVHFYDLHGPYSLPASWRSRFTGRIYDGELAYVDSLIGKLRQKLEQGGLQDRTALIVTADHGEGLGDHGERNHGFFLYRSTTQVPLIIHLPAGQRAGSRVKTTARLIDIAPTLSGIAGVPVPSSFQGRSLLPEMSGHPLPAVAAFSETLYPYLHFHSSPLYAHRDDQSDYIQAPRPELYAVTDARELHNLASRKPDQLTRLRGQLTGLMSAMPHTTRSQQVSAEVSRKLQSLGYLSGGANSRRDTFPPTAGADPKDRMALFRRFQDALVAEGHGQVQQAATELEQIAFTDPALVSAQIEAGLALQRLGQNERSIQHFKAALAVNPENALAHYDLSVSLSNLGKFSDAIEELNAVVGLQPWYSQAYTARGLAQARLGKLQDSLASFDRAIAIDANDFDAWLNRGAVHGAMGDLAKARMDLEKAVSLEPRNASAREALGTLAFHAGDTAAALTEYTEAIKLNPQSSSAHSSLGFLYAKQGKREEAIAEFRKALALDPHNRDAIDGSRMLQ
ncbi:MAG TPA: sulfatase-like hydrolase/transferase [Bryobacteraceae bacterium]|nr:sulfatase-like hydrolase/transferase [Bryobacteraceae bacterium]